MKVWMSQNTKNNNNYTARLILPLIALVVLLPVVTFRMMIIIKESGLSMEIASTVTLIVLTIVIICIALNMGKMANRDSLIFCQDDEHNLFAINARNFVNTHRGIYGYVKMASDVQKALKNIKENQILERQMLQEECNEPSYGRLLTREDIFTFSRCGICNVVSCDVFYYKTEARRVIALCFIVTSNIPIIFYQLWQ